MKYFSFNHNTFLEPLYMQFLSSLIENTMTTWFANKTVFPLIKTASTSLPQITITNFSFEILTCTLLLLQNFQPYFCHTFSQEVSRKSDMVTWTQAFRICLPIYHDINTSVLCSKTFKSIKLMATFFPETSTNTGRLNSGNLKTLIAL